MEPECFAKENDNRSECDECKVWGQCRNKQYNMGINTSAYDSNTQEQEENKQEETVLKDTEKLHLGIMIQKKHVVCTAHRLLRHQGACKNLHGHNYVLTFEIFCKEFDHEGTGMVMDFAEVKNYVCGLADHYLDHKTVLEQGDPLITPIRDVVGAENLVILAYAPTAENMAAMLLVNTNQMLKKEFKGQIFCQKVTVEETPNNSAYAVHEVQ